MKRLNGKTAIVTGGASGIGRALAAELLRRGATVLIVDVAAVRAATDELGCAGATVDVTDADALGNCVREFATAHGRLDYMFNNAGIVVIGEARDLHYEDWTRVLSVNVLGVVNGVWAAYPIMLRQGFGCIVNTASVAGLIPTPESVPYSASKHAVVGLSRSLRAEAKAHGVQVCALCPGFIRTPMADTGKFVGRLSREKALTEINRLGWMSPDDLARAALRGVDRNQSIIVAPGWARALVILFRTFPALGDRFAEYLVRRIRRISEVANP